MTDASQRWVLFWYAMRRRGNTFMEHKSEGKQPVLEFDYERLAEGATVLGAQPFKHQPRVAA